MRHGFQLVDFAAYRGDLGRVRMTYLSNQARFAAAWAIIVTEPFGWRKEIKDINNLRIAIITAPRPGAPEGPSCCLDDSQATTEWMLDNRDILIYGEDNDDGVALTFKLPVPGDLTPDKYAWIEGPLPPDNITDYLKNTIAHIVGLGVLAAEAPETIRQWAFPQLGQHLLAKKLLKLQILTVVTDER